MADEETNLESDCCILFLLSSPLFPSSLLPSPLLPFPLLPLPLPPSVSSPYPSPLLTLPPSLSSKAIASYPSRNFVAETILVCLSRYSPHMDRHSMLLKHLFWVAVGTLQLEDLQLYPAAQLLLQECITHLEERGLLGSTVHPSTHL